MSSKTPTTLFSGRRVISNISKGAVDKGRGVKRLPGYNTSITQANRFSGRTELKNAPHATTRVHELAGCGVEENMNGSMEA